MAYPGFVATEVRERALGGDGKALGKSHINEQKVISAKDCAQTILAAAHKRKREVVSGARAIIGMWLKLLAPSVVDRIAQKSMNSGQT